MPAASVEASGVDEDGDVIMLGGKAEKAESKAAKPKVLAERNVVHAIQQQFVFVSWQLSKNSREWLELKGVAEYAREFSQSEFALAELAQSLLPDKWLMQERLFERVAGATASFSWPVRTSGARLVCAFAYPCAQCSDVKTAC